MARTRAEVLAMLAKGRAKRAANLAARKQGKNPLPKTKNSYYTSPEYYTVESTEGNKRVLDRIYTDYAAATRVANTYGKGWVIKKHKTMKAAEKRYKDYGKRVDKENPDHNPTRKSARKPKKSFVGSVVKSFFPVSEFREIGEGIEGDVGRLVGNGKKRKKVSKAKAKPTTKRKGRRNPESDYASEASQQLFEKFHGQDSEHTTTILERVIIPTDFAELGTLVSIEFLSDTGIAELTFATGKDRVILGADPKTTGLYFLGGDQSVNLRPLGITGNQVKPIVGLGSIRKITYRTKKDFDQFETIDYYHKLGEENQIRPDLAYDTLNQTLLVIGGDYKIKREGITN